MIDQPQMKRAIVFIHGLGGNAKTTWGKFPELISSDPILGKSYDTDTYGFSTSLFSLPFFSLSPRVQLLASGLSTFLINRFGEYDAVTLVCHSLGGLVARQYVLEQTLDKVLGQTSGETVVKIRRLVLYATPNNGSELANIGKLVSWWQPQIKQACNDSDFITTLNKLWLLLKRKDNLNIPVTFVMGDLDRIVSPASARPDWDFQYSATITGASHTDIVKPSDYYDDRYLTLRGILLKEDLDISTVRKDLPAKNDLTYKRAAFFSRLLRSKTTWSLTTAVIVVLAGIFLMGRLKGLGPSITKPASSQIQPPTPNAIKTSLGDIFSHSEEEAKKWLKEEKKIYSINDKALADELAITLPLKPDMPAQDYARWAQGILKNNELISKLRELSRKKNPPFHTLGEEAAVEWGDVKNPLIALVPREYDLDEKIIQVSYKSGSIVVHGCKGIPNTGSVRIQLNKQAFDKLLGSDKSDGRTKGVITIWNPEDVPSEPAAQTVCPRLGNRAR